MIAINFSAEADLEDLVISEIVAQPTAGEYVEIHNTGATVIDLTNVYLTDATFAPNGTFYYNITTGSNVGGGGFADFQSRFPNGSNIQPGEFQTISMAGSDDFFATYGVNPTYELYEDGANADGIPDMLEAVPGSVNQQGGLTDDGEVVVLYSWDGVSDLVQDVDYALWGDKNEAVDKTSVSIDGPDADTSATTYQNDTSIASQAVITTGEHASGMGWSRVDFNEGNETQSGGNGIGGSDETSEDLGNTFSELTTTPNAGPGEIPTPFLVINEVDAVSTDSEFIEIYDGGAGNTLLDGIFVALYDGTTDQVYSVIDLTGETTSVDGYLLIGNNAVSPDVAIPANSLNDGAAAVALYDTSISVGAGVTTSDILDALVYDSGQADDAELLVLLNGGQPQVDENANSLAATESNARCGNGTGGQLNTVTFTQAMPTPGLINNMCPVGDYYATVDTTNAQTLRNTLHNIIDDHTVFPYSFNTANTCTNPTDTWTVLCLADEDPSNNSQVWMVYRNNSYTFQGGGQQSYNREHTWPQSYGFSSGSLGSNNAARTDMHHLMMSDEGYNTDRGNLYFDDCNASCTERPTSSNNGVGGGSGTYPGNSNWFDSNSFEVWNFRKGDIARAMFYMDVRYNGDVSGEVDLELVDNPAEIQSGSPKMGLLSVLLDWHTADPVDAIELERMEVVFSFQGNRNPFIDHPEWVDCVFGNVCDFGNDLIFEDSFD